MQVQLEAVSVRDGTVYFHRTDDKGMHDHYDVAVGVYIERDPYAAVQAYFQLTHLTIPNDEYDSSERRIA